MRCDVARAIRHLKHVRCRSNPIIYECAYGTACEADFYTAHCMSGERVPHAHKHLERLQDATQENT
jgi:hypothetical protein